MSCKNYIACLLKLNGWDNESSTKLIPKEAITMNPCSVTTSPVASLCNKGVNDMKNKNCAEVEKPEISSPKSNLLNHPSTTMSEISDHKIRNKYSSFFFMKRTTLFQ